MNELGLFFLLVAFFCIISDITSFNITNWVLVPSIAIGIYLTGNWASALLMLAIGVAVAVPIKKDQTIERLSIFNRNDRARMLRHSPFKGGDVKMLILCGAFLGKFSIIVALASLALVLIARIFCNVKGKVPFAPFVMGPAIVTCFFVYMQ